MLLPDRPAVVLAPMEGVTDAPMRAVQGEVGAFTYAVSEFLRISHAVPGRGVFWHHVPELRAGGRTPTGLPVQVQLLGGDPGRLAEAAVVAVSAGATAIDLNFGCPAKTVNRHDGGATLLQYPPRIRGIVRAVRDALPRHIPVSAKLRLGWDRVESVFENAAMAAEGGAAWVTVHARTRMQGYQPPVYWPLVGRVREQLGIPVIANGDIWTVADFRRCRDETGCVHFMLGRGAIADQRLSHRVAAELGLPSDPTAADRPPDWPELFRRLAHRTPDWDDRRSVKRLKQWLKTAATCGTFADFDAVKRVESVERLLDRLANRGAELAAR